MSSAWPSATAVWSSWRTTRSPSVTVQRILDNSSYVRSRLKNSSAASCNMCCPRVSSRCATSVSLHLAAVNAWLFCANSSSRSTRRTWGREMLHQSQPIQPQSQSWAAQVGASRCFFSALFNLRGAAHHELFRLLAPTFFLDAGFQSCTQALIRLCTRKLQANRDVAAFLACVGWFFGDTIYSNEQARSRF